MYATGRRLGGLEKGTIGRARGKIALSFGWDRRLTIFH